MLELLAAEKVTIQAKSHKITGTWNSRVFKLLLSPVGWSCALECYQRNSRTTILNDARDFETILQGV
jgi:hypothetical protein